MSEAQTGTVTAHHGKARTQQEAADADLTRRPLEDGHHAARPHDDHAVDGDDQRPSRLPLAPWRPPTLSHRDLPFGTVSWRGPRLEEAPLHLEEGLRLVVTVAQLRSAPSSVREEF